MGDLTQSANDAELTNALEVIGIRIAHLVREGFALTEWAKRNTDALVLLPHVATTLGIAFAEVQIGNLIVSLGAGAWAWLVFTMAVQAETA